MPSVHFAFGGSTAERTLNCPAWRKAVDALPKVDRTSAAAERGTAMHDVMEAAVMRDVSVDTVLAEQPHEFDSFDISQLHTAERAVKTLFDTYGITDVACETLMQREADVGGSCDIIASGPDVCLIADHKFGRMDVSPEANAQLLFYYWLACNDRGIKDMTERKRVVGAIIQPAVSSEPKVYEFSPEEVAAFFKKMPAAIEAARKGGEPRAGSHCGFCAAEPYCSARRSQVHQTRLLPLDQADSLAAALAMIPQLKSFIAAAEAEAETLVIKHGAQLPGFKAVAKKELRKWEDADKAATALMPLGLPKIFTEPALRSPAQISEILKKSGKEFDIAPYLKAPSGELEVAPLTDKRPEVKISVDNSKLSAILASSSGR